MNMTPDPILDLPINAIQTVRERIRQRRCLYTPAYTTSSTIAS